VGIADRASSQQRRAISPGAIGKAAGASALKYSPDQPRVPAGQTGGGQWTAEGDGGDSDENGGDGGNGDPSDDPAPNHSLLDDAVYRPAEIDPSDGPAYVQLASGTISADAPKPGDTIVIKPNDPNAASRFVPDDQLPPEAQDTFGSRTLLPDGNMAVQIPDDRNVVAPDKGDGAVYKDPTADGEANSSRIMTEGTNQYPDGRVIFKNSQDLPIDPYTGNPGAEADTHSHYQGVYSPPVGDGSDSTPPKSGGSSDSGAGSDSGSTASGSPSSALPSEEPRIIIPPVGGGGGGGGYGGNPGPMNPKIPRDALPGIVE